MAGVDVVAALDMYVEKGQWQKCLDTAEQQVKGVANFDIFETNLRHLISSVNCLISECQGVT